MYRAALWSLAIGWLIASSSIPLTSLASPSLATQAGSTARERDLAALRKVHDDWIAAYVAGDLSALERFYTPDSLIMPDNNYGFTGWPQIREFFRAGHERFTYQAAANLQHLDVHGDLGTAVGTVDVTLTPKAGGEPITRALRYLIVFRRHTDGSWRIWLDMDQRFKAGTPGA